MARRRPAHSLRGRSTESARIGLLAGWLLWRVRARDYGVPGIRQAEAGDTRADEMEQAVFARACEERHWNGPALFRSAYAVAAARLGEPQGITARQFLRWRQPNPPCPGPSRQRVLEEMFGLPLERLGFTVPPHRRRPAAGPPAPAVPWFSVLGPVRIRRDGSQPVAVRPQERAMLCALLLRRGRTATLGELIDAVWGESSPARQGRVACQSPGFVETFLCSQLLGEAGPVVVFVVNRAFPATHAV
ncbi:hypothetical protein GCM10009575_013870 [Streptomyces rhizosphaericus]|uniref:OmpR/PhoB-type domain-containing protein n=1 Tax=Streptomyces rhizosphaericus TaxID=114699 RepID=A0ABP3ZG20_9ACTN